MWMVWETGSKSLREIGELFGGLDYAAVAQDSPNQVHLQTNCCTAADHRNVKCLDFDPDLFPVVGKESDKCGIIAESGEDVVWDEA